MFFDILGRLPMGGPRASHGIPWAPKGSHPMGGPGPPPMGSFWAPKGSPSHGPPPMGSLWAPKGPLPWGPTPPHAIPFRFEPLHPIPIPTPLHPKSYIRKLTNNKYAILDGPKGGKYDYDQYSPSFTENGRREHDNIIFCVL